MLIKYLKKNDRFAYAGKEYTVERKARPGEPLKTECGKTFIDSDQDVTVLPKEQAAFNIKDALGEDIKFGANYGYSYHTSGITIVRLGKAMGFTKTGLLTLEVYSSKWGAYNRELTPQTMEKKTISVKPSQLFPI